MYDIPKPNLNRRNGTHSGPGGETRFAGWIAGIFSGSDVHPVRSRRFAFRIVTRHTGLWWMIFTFWAVIFVHTLIASEASAWGVWRASVIALGFLIVNSIFRRKALDRSVEATENKWRRPNF